MTLLIFAIIVAGSAMRLFSKMSADRVPIYAIIVLSQVAGCLTSLLFLFFTHPRELSVPEGYVLPIIAGIFLWAGAVYLGWKGTKRSQLSVRESLIQSRQIFIPVLAAIFLGEVISASAALGIALIVLGISVAAYHPALHWRHPDIAAAGYVLAGSIMVSIASLFDKYIVSSVNATLYSLCIYLGVLIIALLFINKTRVREIQAVLGSRISVLVFAGAFSMSLYFIGQLWLYSFLPLHIAYSLSQLSSVLAIVLAVVVLGERDRLPLKIMGFLIAVIGAVLLKLAV